MKNQIKRLMVLFNGLDRAYGQFTLSGSYSAKGKAEGRAITVRGELPASAWEAHLKGDDGLGVIPIKDDSTVMFGAIDIDSYENFNIEALERRLSSDNIPVVVCRTKSGGAHLYLFAKEPLPAELVRGKLAELADLLEFGDAEVFPKQVRLGGERDLGSWINMPYYDHKSTLRYAVHDNNALDLDGFLDLAESFRVTQTDLESLVLSHLKDEELSGAPPCLMKLCAQGFPEGSRNNGLFNLGVYCRIRWGDDWEARLDKINHKYMKPPLETSEVLNVTKQVKKKSYFYLCTQPPLIGYCNRRVCGAREFGIGGGDDQPPYELGTLVKINSIPPTWFIDVDGIRIELMTDELLKQDKFRKLCVERIDKLPRKMKAESWEKLISKKLEQLEILDAPEDAGPVGQFKAHFSTFITQKPAKDQSGLILNKRWIDNGRIYFRSGSLMEYLEKKKFRDLKERQVYAVLRGMGVSHQQFHIKGTCLQCWSVPEPEVQSEEHDAPKGSPGGDKF